MSTSTILYVIGVSLFVIGAGMSEIIQWVILSVALIIWLIAFSL